jgi:glutaminyl-tRNA synthetase
MRATVVPGTAGGANPEGTKVWGVIHWVDAATSVRAEVRLYDRLFAVPKPEEGGADFLTHMSKTSLEVVAEARVEASLAGAAIGSRWQLERVGYFRVDEDSKPGALVLNRISTLREERHAAVAVEAPAERAQNAKAKTRPKLRSPQEYRAEARARDPELVRMYELFIERGLSADQADLLSGEREPAEKFTRVASVNTELAAKWFINEPGFATLGDADLRTLLDGLADKSLSNTMVKTAVAAVLEGKALADALKPGAPAGDLGGTVATVIAANADKAAQYRGGKTGLLGFFVGQVMKAVPNADAAAVNQAVKAALG